MIESGKELPFNILFLAAGFGTRMGERPKGLLPHKDSTILDSLIENLSASLGMMSFGFMTNAKFAAEYSQALEKYRSRFNIHFLDNKVQTSAGQRKRGALIDLSDALSHPALKDKPTLVLSIDTVFEEPQFFQNLIQVIDEHPGDFVTVMRRFNNPDEIKGRLGCAVMNGNLITEFSEKPVDPPANHDQEGNFWLGAVPFYYYPIRAIKLLREYLVDPTTNHDAPGNVIPFLLQKGFPVRASITRRFTLDIGTAEDIATLKQIR